MDKKSSEEKPYVRTLEDADNILKHAKVDTKNLNEVTQALYYPSADVVAEDFKLLELDDHLESEIRAGQTLCFKGESNEKAVLCTDEKTYEVKVAETSNSLLVIPGLKLTKDTTTSPLKSPPTGSSVYLNRSTDSDKETKAKKRTLEHRVVLKISNEYLECREIRPRFRKIFDLLQLTRFSGPENEELIDKKLLCTFDYLLDIVQSSKMQFMNGLMHYRAIYYDGYIRMLDYEYEYRIINLMVGLISENSWPLDEVDRVETCAALYDIAPIQIVAGLFDIYTFPSEGKELKYTYKEEWVARIVAKNILQPGLKFRADEFMSTWQEALPEGMKCQESYLHALGIFDNEGSTRCIRALAEENLPLNIHDRMKILFDTKTRWTLDEIEPYIEYFTTAAMSVTALLAKYARSLMEDDVRYYMAKH